MGEIVEPTHCLKGARSMCETHGSRGNERPKVANVKEIKNPESKHETMANR